MAKQSAPGKFYRQGIGLPELFRLFPDDAAAEEWFIANRWPEGLRCAHCESPNAGREGGHPQMPFHCRDCRKFFSAKTGTVMQSSKLGYQKWALAIYILTTSIKGTSRMKLHRDLGVTPKTAWHLAHRIRQCWKEQTAAFFGPVEVDETYIGGKEGNKHASKKLRAGRGTVGKTAVVDATDAPTLQGFVEAHTKDTAKVYTDEASAYTGLARAHEVVKHSVGEYVRAMAHTNGVESFWSLLKRGYIGIYCHFSRKHLHRYISEFEGRHNQRPMDTLKQMVLMATGMEGKRLRYADLIA